MLGDPGFVTQRTADALEVIAILEIAHDDVDIIFSDVVMPGMNGVELGKKIRARWPDKTIVLTSGYGHALAEYSGHGFPLLHKPYSVLSRILRDAAA
ncbi:response regulator [Sphingobium sp. UBA5915]|uniref:response regulator n=1 Tax=Sphingobium sp. UBA5915 TaxID=1947530 RepID=UPI0025DA991F|nr:response regulator [Sphingobium sp. UBA5915]